jgi:hypothetical protein
MYKVNGSMKDGYRIIPVVNIRRSVHLLPKFGPVAPADWKSSNVLDKCSHFFVNSLTDRHIYATLSIIHGHSQFMQFIQTLWIVDSE